MKETMGRKGKILQVLGAEIDVEFPQGGGIPNIYNAVVTTNPNIDDQQNNLVLEVAQHLGDNVVRCIAMDSSEGLVRGQEVIDTGAPISVPVGQKTLGRIIDVTGRPIDELGPIDTDTRWPIHRPTPSFEDQSTSKQILEIWLRRSLRVARSDFSAVLEWARPLSSWSLLTTSLRRTEDSLCLQVLVSVLVREMISGMR